MSGLNSENPILKKISKDYGKDSLISGKFLLDKPRKLISIGPALNLALSGKLDYGLEAGSFIILSGLTMCGKSSLSLWIASKCQEQGMDVYFSDAEGRLNIDHLSQIHGLDLDKFNVIRSTENKILSAQDYLNVNRDLIKSLSNTLFIIDSTSALCSLAEISEDITSARRPDAPKLLASFTRQLSNVVPIKNNIVIVIQHVIANTSGYGSPWLEDGGQKIVYSANVKIRGKTPKAWEDNNNKRIGQICNWEIIKNSLGPPGAKVNSYLRYGYGIDEVQELMVLGIELGIIEKSGAWYSLASLGEDTKQQGEIKLREHLGNNPKLIEILKSTIKEMIE